MKGKMFMKNKYRDKLACLILDLNERYHLDDTTNVKFALQQANSGYKIVLVGNKTGSIREITYGFTTPKECYDKFNKDLSMYGKEELERTIFRYNGRL